MPKLKNIELQKKIGLKLKKLRLQKELSQIELSYRSDIDRRQILRIEKGELNTTIGTLSNLAKALGIDIIDLLVE